MNGRGPDRASTLLFFPAALLVVVALASITIDFARIHLARRSTADAAAAAANDAVTVALDEAALRSTGTYRLAPARVAAVTAASVGHHDLGGLGPIRVRGVRTGPRSVQVTVQGRVPLAFARALPGAPVEVPVLARATATAALR